MKDYSLSELVNAANSLIANPPKYELEDGTIQTWRGMPKLPDILDVMLGNRKDKALAAVRENREREEQAIRELEKERKEHPEKFMDLAEFFLEFGKTHKWVQPMKEMTEEEHNARLEFLRRQASEISDKGKQ